MGIRCYMIEPVLDPAKPLLDGKPSIVRWRRPDTGEEHNNPLEFAPGAMWYATWIEQSIDRGAKKSWVLPSPDNRVLVVLTPGGEWLIDSRASNCTMPDDNEHSCWVRHGTPPNITVDKAGKTCGAGAGSIQFGSYHGFLRDGELTP